MSRQDRTRKGCSRVTVGSEQQVEMGKAAVPRGVTPPARKLWWTAVLFAAGSVCFAVASFRVPVGVGAAAGHRRDVLRGLDARPGLATG
jgi:hypothetical protein